MKFCSKCGNQLVDEAVVCPNCGCAVAEANAANFGTTAAKDENRLVRFLLTFFLGWIGSLIINHTSLKPVGYTSRTGCYILLGIVTFGIYDLVASICNLTFDPAKPSNIGYKRDGT